MKIKKLKIEGYKNLNIEFVHSSDIIAIIGNNASGKSNLLEALSSIFKSLYTGEELSFNYFIEYVNSSNQNIKIEKNHSKTIYKLDNELTISIREYLPNNLIAIYSGDEDRLWRKCFAPFYESYVNSVNKAAREGTKQRNELKMIYVDKHYWHLSLLALAISDLEENKSFLKNTLGISKIDKIKFEFNKKDFDKYNDSLVLNFLKNIDSNKEYTLKQFKAIIDKLGFITDDVYKYLYLAFALKDSKIIEDIIIRFDNHLNIEDLSEGEKKLLLIRAAMEFAGQEDSLFILDEPDAHVHINNKEQIIKATEPYKQNRQIIITTHSPTVTQCLSDDNIQMIDKGSIIAKKKQEVIAALTSEFWNKHEQNIFLSSSKDTLLLEGKTDKIHIETALIKLKTKYPRFKDLDFKCLPFNGASGLKLFVDEFPVDSNSLYFAFLDRDQAGKEAIKDTIGFNGTLDEFVGEEKNNIKISCIPKKEGFTKSIFSIEDYHRFETLKDFLLKDCNSFGDVPNIQKSGFKTNFAAHVNSLDVEEFEGFTKLFDLILAVKNGQTIKEANQNPVLPLSLLTIFYLKTNNLTAKGTYNEENETFTVLNTSKMPSAPKSIKNPLEVQQRITKLKSNSKLALKNRNFEFIEDYEFNSPSTAAKFVTGRSSNGWTEWKTKEGQTLDEIYRNK